MTNDWDETYREKNVSDRSWTEAIPQSSLRLIEAAGVGLGDALIDIGGGAARLVDELRRRRFHDLSVLDASQLALDEARARLGDDDVNWIHADLMEWQPDRQYRLWHDRAVFHFLVVPDQQARYVELCESVIEPGGALVMGVFSLRGPETCSGLSVRRWSAEDLSERFANGFATVTSFEHDHVTPWGSVQPFIWVLLKRRGGTED